MQCQPISHQKKNDLHINNFLFKIDLCFSSPYPHHTTPNLYCNLNPCCTTSTTTGPLYPKHPTPKPVTPPRHQPSSTVTKPNLGWRGLQKSAQSLEGQGYRSNTAEDDVGLDVDDLNKEEGTIIETRSSVPLQHKVISGVVGNRAFVDP